MDAETATEGECLIRYGVTGRVAWFAAEPGFDRGDLVVVRTLRGLELGEALVIEAVGRGRSGSDSVGSFRVLRRADADDRDTARRAEELRGPRFELCRRIVEAEGWPLELVDVEPLLDLSTVLLVLPFEAFDPAPIRARFRVTCDFDVHIEDLAEGAEEVAPAEPASPGRCGDCDCGGGGCSRKAAKVRADGAEKRPSPCSTGSHSGCSSCGVAAVRKADSGRLGDQAVGGN